MKRVTIRDCELFLPMNQGATSALGFPVLVSGHGRETVCHDQDDLFDVLWAEPTAARVFRTERECRWYVDNWCGEFGKDMIRQNNRPDSCLAQMYGAVAY